MTQSYSGEGTGSSWKYGSAMACSEVIRLFGSIVNNLDNCKDCKASLQQGLGYQTCNGEWGVKCIQIRLSLLDCRAPPRNTG